jgi:hypothetical protein
MMPGMKKGREDKYTKTIVEKDPRECWFWKIPNWCIYRRINAFCLFESHIFINQEYDLEFFRDLERMPDFT